MKSSNASTRKFLPLRRLLFLSVAFLLSATIAATNAQAQNKKKKNNDTSSAPAQGLQIPDEQKIDTAIGEMLGAWQLGDIEKLHAHYADDVDVVNGTWAPPVVGWPNYLMSYQSQRARTQQVRMDRSNTLVRLAPSGNTAWACYQWEYSAVVDGSPISAFGQRCLAHRA
jgi:ketosteroid isomerase-like protein